MARARRHPPRARPAARSARRLRPRARRAAGARLRRGAREPTRASGSATRRAMRPTARRLRGSRRRRPGAATASTLGTDARPEPEGRPVRGGVCDPFPRARAVRGRSVSWGLTRSIHRRSILFDASAQANRDALLAGKSSRRSLPARAPAGAEPARAARVARGGREEPAVSRDAPRPARDRFAAEVARRARDRGVVPQGVLAQRVPARPLLDPGRSRAPDRRDRRRRAARVRDEVDHGALRAGREPGAGALGAGARAIGITWRCSRRRGRCAMRSPTCC